MPEQKYDPMSFDLTPICIAVTVGNKKYALKEASGDAAVRYRNAQLGCTELGPDGKPKKIVGIGDTEPLLVSLCLFEVTEVDAEGNIVKTGANVPVNTIRSWPARIQKALFEKIKEVSEIDKEDEEAPKDEPSEETDGTD